MMFRRKRMPSGLVEPWEAFQAQAERVERGRQALLGCLPVGRVEPAPVTVGLDVLRDELRAVAAELDEWKVDQVADEWEACAASVDRALGFIERARDIIAATDEMDHIIAQVGKVVGTLDAWHDAERRWLSLRTRQPG